MRKVGYRIFSATFSSWDKVCAEAITYASGVDVINISHAVDKYNEGTIIVWYYVTPERR